MPRQSARLGSKRPASGTSGGAANPRPPKRPRRAQTPRRARQVANNYQPPPPPQVNFVTQDGQDPPAQPLPTLSNDIIERIVAEVHQRMSGNSAAPNTATREVPLQHPSSEQLSNERSTTEGEPSVPFVSVGLPVDARVNEKTRQKIWNKEYVDLGTLLVTPHRQSRFQLTVNHAESNSSPSLVLEPAEKPKKITSIDLWLTAFNVYIGIYTSKHHTEAPALMKYVSIIRDLADRGHNWQFYDENFRFLRQSHVASMPWGSIHSELWLRSHVSNNRASVGARAPTSQRARSDIPFGYCYRFHRGIYCSRNCNFKHSCFKCQGEHRVKDCNFRPPRQNAIDKSPLSAKQPQAQQTKPAHSGASR